MLQKLAHAVKAKTIEFFADDDDDAVSTVSDFTPLTLLDPSPDALITDQKVVVLKPDPCPPNTTPRDDPNSLAAAEAAVAAVASFAAAHLHLQTARSPFLPSDAAAADAAAVTVLRLLSDIKAAASGEAALTPLLQALVRENQPLLHIAGVAVDRLQSTLDARDAAAKSLREEVVRCEAAADRLTSRLDRACTASEVESMLTLGVFDSVLREALRVTHRFARGLVDAVRLHGWDVRAMAEVVYPNVCYEKRRHCQFAIMARVCLGMFDGFDKFAFGSEGGADKDVEVSVRRNEALRQFIEHSSVDPLEVVERSPTCEFARFCECKYKQLLNFGSLENGVSPLGDSAGQLYEMFVAMASSVWTLHRLAWAYDPPVGIFRVERGVEFSAVYMENVVRRRGDAATRRRRVRGSRTKVAFTVIPGFRIGGTVIQSRVYLECPMQEF